MPNSRSKILAWKYFAGPLQKIAGTTSIRRKKDADRFFFEDGTSLEIETPKSLNTAAIEDSEFPQQNTRLEIFRKPLQKIAEATPIRRKKDADRIF